MKTDLIKKSIAAVALFGFVLTAGPSVSSASVSGDNSERMLLAAGGKLGLNGKAHGVPRAPAGTVKPPKKAVKVKPPKAAENRAVDEMMLAKNKRPAPTVDAPVKNAPHAPGAIHGKNSVSSNVMLAKNKKPAPLPGAAPPVDAPVKNAPHAPGAIHG